MGFGKFLDKLTGVEDEAPKHVEEYNEDDYVTVNIDDHQMSQLEQVKQSGQVLVKFHKLKSDLEYNDIVDKVRHNSIVILDIGLLKNSDFTGLKMFSGKLKQKCTEMGWSLGALSNELLMVTPTHIKFEKKKKEMQEYK
ncbi:hypothetical protein COV16_04805 [Candidatus Woesearchaeota archaeon CG10_big_fil_rev_8_21_14_0_10_34_8]|nr:MAG: hypothetical protein COV16_04805 [Candidatus Woesearchaeota archaeon CG10_big_fil_rev_8_21_14_0_10_34_8]